MYVDATGAYSFYSNAKGFPLAIVYSYITYISTLSSKNSFQFCMFFWYQHSLDSTMYH